MATAERDEADGEFQRPLVLASAAARSSPGRAEQQERADQETETDRDRQVAGLLRRGRAAGQRGHHRDFRDRLRRPGGGEVGRDDRQGHRDADDRPRQLEHAHDVVRAVLGLRAVGEPGEEAERRSRDGAHDAGGGAVGPDDQADVPLRRALSGEHADRPQPALREDGEAADADKRDQQHAEHGRGDRDRLGVDLVGVRHRLRGRHVHGRGAEARRADPRRVEQHRHVVRIRDLAGDDQGELVEQALRVLDDAGYLPGLAGDGPVAAGRQVEVSRDPAGHGDLARRGGVLAADQAQQRPAVRTARDPAPAARRCSRCRGPGRSRSR